MESIFSIDKIYLMLGSACNMKCRHCYETDVPQPRTRKEIHQDVWNFLEEICALNGKNIVLTFWGGEPLLYFYLIKQVIDRFGEGFRYAVQTNGLLLSEEIVEYFNANKVLCALSNDGPQTARVRLENVLDDPRICELYKKLDAKCIGVTTHAYNIDPHALESYVKDRVGKTKLHYQYHLECTFDMDKDLYEYNYAKYRENLRKCRAEYITDVVLGTSDDTIARSVFRHGVKSVMEYVKRRQRGETPCWWPACASMRKRLNIDILGFVHICHNRESAIGRVTDSYEALLAENDRKLREYLRAKPECEMCEVNFLCRYGCPLNKITEAQKKCCAAEKIYWIQSLLAVEDAAKITTEIDI